MVLPKVAVIISNYNYGEFVNNRPAIISNRAGTVIMIICGTICGTNLWHTIHGTVNKNRYGTIAICICFATLPCHNTNVLVASYGRLRGMIHESRQRVSKFRFPHSMGFPTFWKLPSNRKISATDMSSTARQK